MVAPRSPAPLGSAVLPAVFTSLVPFLSLPPTPPCSNVIVAGLRSPLMGKVAVFGRSVTTPRHGRGHGPKVAALDTRGTSMKRVMIQNSNNRN